SEDMSFEDACEKVKGITNISNEELLEVYALYKQAVVGDCDIPAPEETDEKGHAKWTAWDGKRGMSSDDAKTSYVALVDILAQMAE
ncbi:hypothetical protein PENTCL1PPCAC_9206, partial [Pristionchus entomophagus]